MSGPGRGEILFVLSHQNHLKCFLPVIERLAESLHPVHCAIPQEAVVKRRLTYDQVEQLRRSAPVWLMRRGALEALQARLAPHAFSRPRRWAGRLGRLVRSQGLKPATVALPLHLPNLRYVRGAIGGGARIVCLQHDPYTSTAEGADLSGYPVDLFCAWGDHMERFFREHGVRQEIRITGAPHLERRPPRRATFGAREPVRLLYATQPTSDMLGIRSSPVTPGMKRRAIDDLLRALSGLPPARLTIKLHPADDGRIERSALAGAGDLANRIVLAEHEPARPIGEFIDAADLVITILSTVAFEAVVHGKPIVLLNYDDVVVSNNRLFGAGRDYLSAGVALPAVDGASLAQAWRRTLYDDVTRASLHRSRDRFLDEHLRFDSTEAQLRICVALTGSRQPTDGCAP